MMRRWGRCGALLTGVGLLVLTGCVPTKQLAKGPDDQPPPRAEGPQVEKSGEAAPAQKATPGGEGSPAVAGYRVTGEDPLVKERIDLFAKKKEEWYRTGSELAALQTADAWPDSWEECLQDIELALTGYRAILAGKERDLQPWAIVGRDLHYVDQGCDQVLALARDKVSGTPADPTPQAAATTATPPATAPPGAGDQVRQLVESGQYQEAATAYEALAQGQPAEKPGREVRESYSRALIKLGRFTEAASLLTELLQEGGQASDLPALESRLLTADVLLAAGQLNEARQLYEGVAKALAPAVREEQWATAHAQAFAEQVNDEDLALYQELLQAYLLFDGQQVPQELVDGVGRLQGRTPGPLIDLARMLLTRATAQAQEWARGQLAEVRALIDRQELAQARELVERMATMAPAEMKEAITALLVELAQAEVAAETAPPSTGGEVVVDPWAEALTLLEQKQYDAAIAGLQKLVAGERGAEARAKMAEAAELAAAEMRQQAAALYAKARKTVDPAAKHQALQDSRTLLHDLIAKYPEASIVAKARQNLKVLDGELGQTGSSSPPAPAAPAATTPQ